MFIITITYSFILMFFDITFFHGDKGYLITYSCTMRKAYVIKVQR